MQTAKNSYDVIVVGGGASGMMAAGRAGALGKRVLLLEKNNKLGAKLAISGGGRCNITNDERDTRKLLAKFGDSEQFLYSSFSQFGVKESFEFFESLGLPLKVEANNRAFPETENAVDVVKAMREYMKRGRVEVRLSKTVERVSAKGGKIEYLLVENERLYADAYIFATGGVSHPETGSTGDGFTWLKKLGHTINAPTPTIVPITTKEKWSKELSGTTLEKVRIVFYVNDKKKIVRVGNVLLTHFGLSGPLILNVAGEVDDLLQEGTVTARIDMFPNLDIGQLDAKLITVFAESKNKFLRTALKEIVPTGIADAVFMLLPHIHSELNVHSVTKEQRREIVTLLLALPLTVTGLLGYDRAVLADGGVPLTEVDMRTMRSQVISNLFLTGDLLHIKRPSGGYSLQLCWTTGYVAGTAAIG